MALNPGPFPSSHLEGCPLLASMCYSLLLWLFVHVSYSSYDYDFLPLPSRSWEMEKDRPFWDMPMLEQQRKSLGASHHSHVESFSAQSRVK